MNKQQYNTGRIYLLQSGGKNKLGFVSSTGKTTERSEGDKRKKAKFGLFDNINVDNLVLIPEDTRIDKTKGIASTPKLAKNNLITKVNFNLPEVKKIENPNKFNIYKDTYNNYKRTENIKSGISLGTNLLSNIGSMLINNKMLNSLKAPNDPMPKRATKMLTSINVNPQIDRVRENVNSMQEDIDNNTSSSKVALNRKNKVNTIGVGQYNQIQGQKANIETQLINTDRQNQQNVNNTNVDAYNAWDEKKTAFENAVREKKSENIIGSINSIANGVQSEINRLDRKDNERQTILAMMAAHPNVNPRILKALGLHISDKDIANWDKIYAKTK